MVVTATVNPTLSMLPAGGDPRLPAGIWRSSASTLAGDATGSYALYIIELVAASYPDGHALAFTLEELTFSHQNPGSDENASVQVNGFVKNPFDLGGASMLTRFHLPLTQNHAGGTAMTAYAGGLGNQSLELGFRKDATQAEISIFFPNVDSTTYTFSAWGYFYLAGAPFLPGGVSVDPGELQHVQRPNYAVGDDSYYAQLRRGEQPVMPQPQPVAQVPARRAPAGPVRVPVASQNASIGAPVRSTDEQLINRIAGDVLNTGSSLTVAAARILGQSPNQVNAQLTRALPPGRPPAPGAAYANIGGRFEEGSGV